MFSKEGIFLGILSPFTCFCHPHKLWKDTKRRKKMKVKFQYGLAGYTGKADGLIYCYNRKSGKVYARRKVQPKITAHNHKTGSITANLHSLKPSTGFKNDLRLYSLRYNGLPQNAEKNVYSWVNLYLIMMHKLAEVYPEVDLSTITREYIYAHNLPCISIKRAVETGLLPEVQDWQFLDHSL